MERELSEDQTALLAAGPLENLMVEHGAIFIDRVEEKAKASKRFNHLLGAFGVKTCPKISGSGLSLRGMRYGKRCRLAQNHLAQKPRDCFIIAAVCAYGGIGRHATLRW